MALCPQANDLPSNLTLSAFVCPENLKEHRSESSEEVSYLCNEGSLNPHLCGFFRVLRWPETLSSFPKVGVLVACHPALVYFRAASVIYLKNKGLRVKIFSLLQAPTLLLSLQGEIEILSSCAGPFALGTQITFLPYLPTPTPIKQHPICTPDIFTRTLH